MLVRPGPLLLLALGVHIAGRIAAFCGPFKVDSLVYAVSAYRIWQPDATVRELVPDKPPGQMLLTGWCYSLWPGEPSRLTLVPIESLFLLSAYAVFWLLCRRLFGDRLAAALTLLLVIACNAYNALDTTTDGFNLNENYLALPMWAAVLAHLTVAAPVRRGVLRGLGIGVALAIKQTAAGLVIAIVIHGLLRLRSREHRRQAGVSLLASAAMVALIGAAMLLYLFSRGWLSAHLQSLLHSSGHRVGPVEFRWPEDYKVLPIVPFMWWAALGIAALLWTRLGAPWCGTGVSPVQRGGFGSGRPPSRPGNAGDIPRQARGPEATGRTDQRKTSLNLLAFASLWLAAEALILWHLQIPSTHYYQQIVAPCALLAGAALTGVFRRLRQGSTMDRINNINWITATTVGLGLLAVMPLLAATSKLAQTFDAAAEVKLFRDFAEELRQQAERSPGREVIR